jgi:predicted TIM-barrel fold metal-dependent hydrolase
MLREYPESVVFSSDYPHADGTFPGSTKDLLETTELDDDQVRRVLRDNAHRLYGMAG